jgi:hypothetical protein
MAIGMGTPDVKAIRRAAANREFPAHHDSFRAAEDAGSAPMSLMPLWAS